VSVEGFAPLLADIAVLASAVAQDRLRDQMYAAGEEIVETAKDMLGTEHPGLWAPLEQSTQARRASEGYPADEPLVRQGELRAAIREVRRDSTSIEVGIDADDPALPVGLAMEFGFIHYESGKGVDPRPFLGPATETVMAKYGERLASVNVTAPGG
jgi:hypothetical protein